MPKSKDFEYGQDKEGFLVASLMVLFMCQKLEEEAQISFLISLYI